MTGGGESLETGDGLSFMRLQQKLFLIDTAANLNALTTTYPGQRIFATSTAAPLSADTAYERDAANTTWNTLASRLATVISETTEQSTTPITDDTNFTPTATRRYYAYFTLPSSASDPTYYFITKIEWKNGSAVAGNILSGVNIVDANPPTVKYSPLVCVGQEVAQSGTNTTQFTTIISSLPIKAGSVVGVWIQASSGSARLKTLAGQSSSNYALSGSVSGSLLMWNTQAWIAISDRIDRKSTRLNSSHRL